MFGYAYLKAYVESAKPKLEIFKNKIYPTKATEKREENRVLPPITIKQVAIQDERNKTEKTLSG